MESGAAHLTLDAVASKARVSRGGLLYHFPDKEALLKGMLDRLIDNAKARRMKKRAELAEGKGRELRAYVLSFVEQDEGSRRAGAAALFALGAHGPELLVPVRKEYRKLIDDITGDGLAFERAAVVALATDGLRLAELLSISPFNKEERRRVVEEILALSEEERP
jgi:AcrR family transcriptional regulator